MKALNSLKMQPREAMTWMMFFAVCAFVVVCCYGHPWQGLATMTLALMPVLSLAGGTRLWKPWFMEGIDDEVMPDMTFFVTTAFLFDLAAAVAIATGHGWAGLVVRLLGTALQLSHAGKLTREITSDHEIRTQPAARSDAGNARQP